MGAICLIDTSIFLEILNVPQKASQSELIFQELKEKFEAKESLFLPMATILETGNHIAQNGDGNQRRTCAEKFVNQVTQALEGKSPFIPINFLKKEDLQGWLKEFPDEAMQARGLGDLSIIHDWQRICDQNPSRRVYIWSLDKHLKSYNRPPKL
ncbi:MAG: hypothetical protein EWV53_04335 [Microcystis panniformis Mp_MB_F_20051200_S9]|uniref:PIN domain-containing protein n=1 Tax=Microcystis panniformis Mp_MB_F_20051200_S9 TaxID=2486223 RepID=A0A552Q7V5_9CHRO|nr:MAG: hypothetical protein EWV87_14720 [Microcystis panniformis Mp_GB_SS_20050300_S99]TRV50161.1 MAG: hypothetical protein EWV43_06795 [Microcystis panniformis Mp_MB_F_20080800_S26D]TRV51760.1 MAG: hypothetical protein EWV42_09225 [Microcystis panniformis Mp_GB_SS_20050300_S99D]TRV57145.1 MAG: hypothetical protein EWV86_21380 [Microcystis panniformis Mp_MB_F_20051200_S9D]TRV62276.1 MAG: hypothetical protein EWV69_06085 [Microcystis panniformis Mp_MB_F_20080800_S26]TRV65307.1 MAG: hypothetica